jgi:transposase
MWGGLAHTRSKWGFALEKLLGKLWLTDEEWAALKRHLPQNQAGARRVDDRRVISGILYVLKTGCHWRDCPPVYGPASTIYNRYNRWARRSLWRRLYTALGEVSPEEVQAINAAMAKAHRLFGDPAGEAPKRPRPGKTPR